MTRYDGAHELGQLVIVGICQHGRARIYTGRQPGLRRDAYERAVSTRHNVYSRPRPRQVDRDFFSLPQRLDLFAHLRCCV